MKVLIDTNVILDILCDREEFEEASSRILELCETGMITGYISAMSFPNIVYIMRKELTNEKIRKIIDTISAILKVTDLKSDDLKKAAMLEFKDYEDALQSVCAMRVKADFIVTRNVKDFQNSRIPAIKPSELLERIL